MGAAKRLGVMMPGHSKSNQSIYQNEFDTFMKLNMSSSVERKNLLWTSKPVKNDLRNVEQIVLPKRQMPSVFKQISGEASLNSTGRNSILKQRSVEKSINTPYVV